MVRGKATSLLIALFLSFSTLLLIGNSTVAAHTAYIATLPISITVTSPTNTNYSSSVPLVFILPINGTFDLPFGIEGGTGGNGRGVWGIKGYSYSVDDHSNVSIAGNITLNGLAEGEHRIVVYVHRWVYYGIYYGGFEDTVASREISFSVHQPPENQTCNTNDLPLNAKLPQPNQWIATANLLLTIVFVVIVVVVFRKRKISPQKMEH